MMIKKLLAALALAALSAVPAAAQKDDPAPVVQRAPRYEPTAESRALALELIRVTEVEKNLGRAFELGMRSGAGEDATPKVMSMVRSVFRQEVRWAELQDEFVTVYAQLFTADELRQLIAFHQTPLGRRLTEASIELTLESQRILSPSLTRVLQEVMRRAQEMDEAAPSSGAR